MVLDICLRVSCEPLFQLLDGELKYSNQFRCQCLARGDLVGEVSFCRKVQTGF